MKKSGKLFLSLVLSIALTVLMVCPVFAGQKHTVTFMYGTNKVVMTVDHGTSALPPSDTEVPGYTFLGWVGNPMDVTEDRVILGAYFRNDTPAPASVPAQDNGTTFTVKFVDSLTGANYYNQTVSAGSDANPPELPHHDGWHFDHYEGSYQCVDSNRTVTAVFKEDWHWIDDPWDQWWTYYSTDDPDFYVNYWWM